MKTSRAVGIATLALSFVALSIPADAAAPDSVTAELVNGAPPKTQKTERDALLAKSAALRNDRRFAPLKAEFEVAAKIPDKTQRKMALREAVTKAERLRKELKLGDVIAKNILPPKKVVLSPDTVAQLQGLLSVNIAPNAFNDPHGSKSGCNDEDDTFSFPGGDPMVDATSTPLPGDQDCASVVASKAGGKFDFPKGAKSARVLSTLDYNLNADVYALASWGKAKTELVVTFVTTSFQIKGGKTIGGNSSFKECLIVGAYGETLMLGVDENNAKALNETTECTIEPTTVGAGGPVLMSYAVRTSIDADLTAVSQGDARLERIRSVRVQFKH